MMIATDLVKTGLDAGLQIHGEVGSKETKVDIGELIRQAELLLSAGCDTVLFEAAELVDQGTVDISAIEKIKASLPAHRTMIELPGPWIKGVTKNDVYETMKTIVRIFGSDANLGNIAWDQVIELECMRCGIGTAGPAHLSSYMPERRTQETSAKA